jgi:hypothetical protein
VTFADRAVFVRIAGRFPIPATKAGVAFPSFAAHDDSVDGDRPFAPCPFAPRPTGPALIPEDVVMRWTIRLSLMLIVFAVGYGLGRVDTGRSSALIAQEAVSGPTEETARKIQTANDALKAALEGLKNESLYNPATKGMNVTAVLAGGVDAIDDLESGRGVDPETFAALYADLAVDEVAQHLAKDVEGRLTYKNKLVRIYPVSRLKRLNTQRAILAGEIQKPRAENP